jgi:hypothetical protein
MRYRLPPTSPCTPPAIASLPCLSPHALRPRVPELCRRQ